MVRRSARQLPRWAWWFFGLIALVVAVIVFNPHPPDPDGQRRLMRWLTEVHHTWMPYWVTFSLVEFLANVVMFAPLGFFATLALWRRRWWVVPGLAAFSAVIELVQWVALPQRQGSLLDIAANTLGALVGYVVAILLRRCTDARVRSSEGQRAP